MFNNGEYRIFATLRAQTDKDAEKPEFLAFTNDDNSYYFAIRNDRNGEQGVLSDRAIQFTAM